jgi:hypothetical protein
LAVAATKSAAEIETIKKQEEAKVAVAKQNLEVAIKGFTAEELDDLAEYLLTLK